MLRAIAAVRDSLIVTNAREQARNEIAALRSNKSASPAGILVGLRELALHAAPSARAAPLVAVNTRVK
jgi:hypothetical protein